MAPSAQDIASYFEKIGEGGGGFITHVDQNVKLDVMGHEHRTKNSHQSHEALVNDFFGQFEFVDWNTVQVQVRQIIGGGQSEWASVELTLIGSSKKGKPINHECAVITHFNNEGKIDEMRAYLDTAHMDSHFAAYK